MTAFPHLFAALDVGPVRLKNRILSTGHMTQMVADGKPTDDLVVYHEARARGGAGLIIVESAIVHPTAGDRSHLVLYDDGCIPGYRRIAKACHAFGTKLFAQLGHSGRIMRDSRDGTLAVAYAPASLADERFHVVPRALPAGLIAEIVAAYGAAAKRMRAAGFDGVEIMASHGLLPAQFLNPRTNPRTDAYGGSPENRRRFLAKVIAAVNAQAGESMAVGVRISGDEMEAGGLTPDEVLEALGALAPGLDYVNVTAGSMAGLAGSVHVVPPMAVPVGYVAPIAGRIRVAIDKPVFVAGRINQPQIAERILAEGQADACGMTRAMICDPEMANKAATGRSDDIRACIGCNQACIGHMQAGYPISCIQHPESGRERRFAARRPAPEARRVLVAGGGPGGMKAAAVAAERGHRVTLYEAGPRLGGQVLLAQILPSRSEFGGIVTNLAAEMARAGVIVVTRTAVTRALVEAETPDAVIVATGAGPAPAACEIAEGTHVVDAWQVLEGANVGRSVVIADWRADWIGLGLAERLARDGCHVRLAVNGTMAGETVQQYVRDHWVGVLHRLGVEVIPYARLYGADGDTVYLQHTTSGEAMVIEGVDTLVTALGHRPDTALEDALAGWPGAVHLAGDCLAPRTAEEAVLEGLVAGTAV